MTNWADYPGQAAARIAELEAEVERLRAERDVRPPPTPQPVTPREVTVEAVKAKAKAKTRG